MNKQNTYLLEKWILQKDFTEKETEEIEEAIGAFSEYIVAVNPDYLYSKTYLISFLEEFFNCRRKLKKKREILESEILLQLQRYEVDYQYYRVNIDNAWINQNGKTSLLNNLNITQVKSNKMQFDIEYTGKSSFAIADEVDLTKDDYKNILADKVMAFIKRYQERISNV